MTRLEVIALIAAFFILFGVVGHFDEEADQADHDNYCEMVSIWNKEAAQNIQVNDRAGWPPYNGECTK